MRTPSNFQNMKNSVELCERCIAWRKEHCMLQFEWFKWIMVTLTILTFEPSEYLHEVGLFQGWRPAGGPGRAKAVHVMRLFPFRNCDRAFADIFTTTLHLHSISLHLPGPWNLDPVRLHPPLREGFPHAHHRTPSDHGPPSSHCYPEQDSAEGIPCQPSADGT